MVTGSAKQKVSGGKLISVHIEFDDSVRKVEILGDFFMHPEEKLREIERSLVGIGIDESEGKIRERIEKVAKENNIEMIGVTPEAISSTIKMAIANGMESNRS
jgi:hypothetical protein